MPEIIDITKDTSTAIVQMNAFAMLTQAEQDAILPIDSKPRHMMEVEVRLNGVPVPLVKALDEAFALVFANENRRIEEKALEMLKARGLDSLVYAIQQAEYQIEQAFDQVGVKLERRD